MVPPTLHVSSIVMDPPIVSVVSVRAPGLQFITGVPTSRPYTALGRIPIFANVHVLFPQHCVSVFKLLVSDGTADNEDVDAVATDEIDMNVEGVGEDNEDVDVGGVATDDVKYGAAVWLHCAHHADATDVADAKSCTMLHDAMAQFAIAWMARLKCALLQIQSELGLL